VIFASAPGCTVSAAGLSVKGPTVTLEALLLPEPAAPPFAPPAPPPALPAAPPAAGAMGGFLAAVPPVVAEP